MLKRLKKAAASDIRFHIVLLFLIMLVANFLTPRMVDDLFQRQADTFDFTALFSYLKLRYLTWSGRMVADGNNTLFLGFPKIVFNIVNSLMYVLLIFLMYCHALGAKRLEKERGVLLFLVAEILAFFNFPSFGQVVLWESGAANYLWNAVIIFAFLLPYRVYADAARNEENGGRYFHSLEDIVNYFSFYHCLEYWPDGQMKIQRAA